MPFLRPLILVAALASAPLAPAVAGLLERPGSVAAPKRADTAPADSPGMRDGFAALNRNDLDAARAGFEAAAKQMPKSPEPLIGLAEVARLRNDRADTERWLKKALELAPDRAETQLAWGRYQFGARNFAGAGAALQRAAALAPKSGRIQLDLGDLYLTASHDPVRAEAAYRKATELSPDLAGAHYGLGMALVAQKQLARARTSLERAATLAPDNPMPTLALAELYGASHENDLADATFDKLLAARPDFVPGLLGRGDAQLGRRDPARALADYERAATLAPKNADIEFKIARAYYALGRFDDTAAHYKKAIAIDPKHAPSLNNLAALAAERRRDLDVAMEWIRQALAIAPGTPVYIDTLGSVQLARGDVDAAIASFRKAAASTPQTAVFYVNLGRALAQGNHRQEAATAYRQALALDSRAVGADEARRYVAEVAPKN